MDEPQIYARLTKIFEDVFDEDSIQVTPELSAKDVDGWDSLAHIRLILTIERAFKIKFSTSEVGKLQNVGELVALIQASSLDWRIPPHDTENLSNKLIEPALQERETGR